MASRKHTSVLLAAIFVAGLILASIAEGADNRASVRSQFRSRRRVGALGDWLTETYNAGKEITGEMLQKAKEGIKEGVDKAKELVSKTGEVIIQGQHMLKEKAAERFAPFVPDVTGLAQQAFDTIGQRHARYAFASYCPGDAVKTWTCKYCTLLCSKGGCVTSVTVNTGGLDLSSWTGVNKATKEIIVAFRGTVPSSFGNWLVDLQASKIRHPWRGKIPGEAAVHAGFFTGYQSMKSALVSQTQDLMKKNPGFKLIITGHSLGGAMAVVCAADFKLSGIITDSTDVHVTTFGEPRVGNADFRAWMAKAFPSDPKNPANGKIWQFAYYLDLVPHVPLNDMGFSHVPLWIWMRFHNGKNEYRICTGPDDKKCAPSVPLVLLSTIDHSLYFNPSGTKYC